MTELPGSRPLSRLELSFVSAKNKQACVFLRIVCRRYRSGYSTIKLQAP